jgi:hypothetical protein
MPSVLKVSGGIQTGEDGRAHGTFGHNPSSLRLCMFDPNLQQIPRGSSEEEKFVKEMFVAPEGYTFWDRDFSGIEAVLVGYFAGSRQYTRLAKLDVHSFYTAYALNALDGRVHSNDLPGLDWDDARLKQRLGDIKAEFKEDRNGLYKHLVHGANFLQSPGGAQKKIFKETNRAFDIRLIRRVMGVYFELFPEIREWHKKLCLAVDGGKQRTGVDDDPWSAGVCYARNPFGYVHHFYNVLDWECIEVSSDGKKEWLWTYGEDAKRLVAFLPQSTAAAIIKQAAKRIYYEVPAVGESLRLLIHDSIFGETLEENVERCLKVSREVMESPIPQLPLDPTWGMGEFLSIGTEAAMGRSWGSMSKVKD